MIAQLWLTAQIWMQRRRRELLIQEQAGFELRAHEAHMALADADRSIALLRKQQARLRRGMPEGIR